MGDSLAFNVKVFLGPKNIQNDLIKHPETNTKGKLLGDFKKLDQFKDKVIGCKSVVSRKQLRPRKVEVYPESSSSDLISHINFSSSKTKPAPEEKKLQTSTSSKLLPRLSNNYLELDKIKSNPKKVSKIILEIAKKKFDNKEFKDFEEFSMFVQNLMQEQNKRFEGERTQSVLKNATIIWNKEDFKSITTRDKEKSDSSASQIKSFLRPKQEIRAWSPVLMNEFYMKTQNDPFFKSSTNFRRKTKQAQTERLIPTSIPKETPTTSNQKPLEENLIPIPKSPNNLSMKSEAKPSSSNKSKTQSPRPVQDPIKSYNPELPNNQAVPALLNLQLHHIWENLKSQKENDDHISTSSKDPNNPHTAEKANLIENPTFQKKSVRKSRYLQIFNTTTQEILSKISKNKKQVQVEDEKPGQTIEEALKNEEENIKSDIIIEEHLKITERNSQSEHFSEISSKKLHSEPEHVQSSSIFTDPHAHTNSAATLPDPNPVQQARTSRRSLLVPKRSKTMKTIRNKSVLSLEISASIKFIQNFSYHLIKQVSKQLEKVSNFKSNPENLENFNQNPALSVAITDFLLMMKEIDPATPEASEPDLKESLATYFKDKEIKPEPIKVNWPTQIKTNYFERRLSTYIYFDNQIDEENKDRIRLKNLFLQDCERRHKSQTRDNVVVKEIVSTPATLDEIDLEIIERKRQFSVKINKIIRRRNKKRVKSIHEKCKLIK